MQPTSYSELGQINGLQISGELSNMDRMILSFDTNKTLHISYTVSCCEVSQLYFSDKLETVDDYNKLFIGKTITTIEYICDDDDGYEEKNGLYTTVHIYEIKFTDNETVLLKLSCESNGYYDSRLVTEIKKNDSNKYYDVRTL